MVKIFVRMRRLTAIFFTAIHYGLDEYLVQSWVKYIVRFLLLFTPAFWRNKRQAFRPGVRLRLALESLGPIFVKFGQVLSTRLDILPEQLALDLAPLQDQVAPFCNLLAVQTIEAALEQPIDSIFLHFTQIPIASASVAQVHAAILKDGSDVVVKILRPGINKIIDQDLEILSTFARILNKWWPSLKRFRLHDVIEEFNKMLHDELDLMREAGNCSQLKRNFKDSAILSVPKVHWPLTRSNILVMERMYGETITQVDALLNQGVDMKKLAERGVEIFFTQVFRDCFFHADMHPGNVLVNIKDPKNPSYIALDFGIMGTLGPVDQKYLAENLLAFFKQNYRRVAELHVESGWVPGHTRVDEFESAIRSVCEPIFERPLKDISFGQTLLRLFQTARRFNMEVQPQLILLQKTLISVEGLGRQIYPELDLWHSAKPFLERWMNQQVGPRALIKAIRFNAPIWFKDLPALPAMLIKMVELQNQQLSKELANQRNVLPIKGSIGPSIIICSLCLIIAWALFEEYSRYILAGLGLLSTYGMGWYLGNNQNA